MFGSTESWMKATTQRDNERSALILSETSPYIYTYTYIYIQLVCLIIYHFHFVVPSEFNLLAYFVCVVAKNGILTRPSEDDKTNCSYTDSYWTCFLRETYRH